MKPKTLDHSMIGFAVGLAGLLFVLLYLLCTSCATGKKQDPKRYHQFDKSFKTHSSYVY